MTAEAVTLRPARAGDAAAVVALLQAEGLEDAFHPDEFTVAEAHGRVVGCARLKRLADGGHELASVAVAPDQRGHGVGKQLVEAAIAAVSGPVYGLAVSAGFFETLGAKRLAEVPAPLREKAEGACATADFVPMVLRAREDAHAEVREAYGAIAAAAASNDAADGASCCGPSCCGGADADAAGADAADPHYSAEELASLPPGANLRLGTGNPVRAARLQPGDTVVDLGSGPGGDAILAAHAVGPRGRVVGVDITPEMVARATANARAAGVANARFHEAPIEDLPVPDAAADVVISNCVINLSPHKAAALREAHRVLKPGGRLVVSDTLRLEGEAPGPGVIDCGCAGGALSEAEWKRELEAAGFEDVDVAVEGDFAPGVARAMVRARKPAT